MNEILRTIENVSNAVDYFYNDFSDDAGMLTISRELASLENMIAWSDEIDDDIKNDLCSLIDCAIAWTYDDDLNAVSVPIDDIQNILYSIF